ncbi:MAG: DMT family transporter, partial [Acidobacteria bacterium]|nr:DMT family transporter [Acidobacteriota bacterium]
MTRGRAIALLVFTTMVWGATFPVVKGALADAGVWTFLAVRFGLAAVLLAPTARRARWPRSPWVAACGVALLAGYAFQTWGLVTTTPARSAFITALSVILVPLVEPLVGMARLTWRVVTGALLALTGLGVLLRPESGAASLGDILTFGCALAFAAHTLLVQRAVREVDASAVNAWQVVIVGALALPFGLTDTAPLHLTWR